HIILRQIAAEELGVALESVHLVTNDTDAAPYDQGCVARRTTHIGGNPGPKAVAKAKAFLLRKAAQMLEAAEEDLEVADGKIAVKGSPDRRRTPAEVGLK